MPPGSYEPIARLLMHEDLEVKISNPRQTKLGDYTYRRKEEPAHKITLNRDLNPYNFLITLLHEAAHMHAWQRHKGKVLPHGAEWKGIYGELLTRYMDRGFFPDELELALKRHLASPTAATCTDRNLLKALKQYDPQRPDLVTVEELPMGAHFTLPNGRVYKKGERIKIRYLCTDISTQKRFRFHPLAEVTRVRLGLFD